MAEVEKIIGFFGREGRRPIRDREGAGRRLRLRRAWASDQRCRHGSCSPPTRSCSARSAVRNGTGVAYDVRPEAGLLRLRKDLALYANLRPAICYPALARRLLAQARGRRGARHHDRARADRRRLFRRAEADHRSRQRTEARHRHPGLRHVRNRAHRPRRLRTRAQARQQGDVVARSAM